MLDRAVSRALAMDRRAFLASLGLAPGVARSYFDMGAAWRKHESGLIVPDCQVMPYDLVQYVIWEIEGAGGVAVPLHIPPLIYRDGVPQHCAIHGDSKTVFDTILKLRAALGEPAVASPKLSELRPFGASMDQPATLEPNVTVYYRSSRANALTVPISSRSDAPGGR